MLVDRDDWPRDRVEVGVCVVEFCSDGVVAVVPILLEEGDCCGREGLLAVRAVVVRGRVHFLVGAFEVCFAGFDEGSPCWLEDSWDGEAGESFFACLFVVGSGLRQLLLCLRKTCWIESVDG